MWQYRQSSSNKGDSLAHFGILGMHWGVRRYQNPDGTLTEEGKKRYGHTDSGSETKAEAKKQKKNESKPLTKKQKERQRLVDQAAQYYKDAEKTYLEAIEMHKQDGKNLQKAGPESAEDWLQRNFGNDWKDFQYIKDIWDIDDPLAYAKSESEKDHRYQLERAMRLVTESKEDAKRCAEIAKKWGNTDINNLTKDELEELKNLDKELRFLEWANKHLLIS